MRSRKGNSGVNDERNEKEGTAYPEIYRIPSYWQDPERMQKFLRLKANVCALNPALVKKCVTGTEQDFLLLMGRARDFLRAGMTEILPEEEKCLLQMFRECVFGYYVLTPLVEAEEVSDIKVYSAGHVTVKVRGRRYVSDVRFSDEEDYESWYDRILRILKIGRTETDALASATDRKGVPGFFLRVDAEQKRITSTGVDMLHIRKIPKKKLSWEYLFRQDMLTQEQYRYLTDRIRAGYGFLISGKGGSGKSTLLNNLIDLIPFDQSVLVSQESDELYSDLHPEIQFEHTLSMQRGGRKAEFTLEDELRMGLLQDIDNFVIGEIKGGEALYVFTTAISTGARFFGTIHANSAAGSVRRLAQCARYTSDYPVATLEEMLSSVPFVVIHMSNFAIDEILEIRGWDEKEEHLLYREVFRKGGGI